MIRKLLAWLLLGTIFILSTYGLWGCAHKVHKQKNTADSSAVRTASSSNEYERTITQRIIPVSGSGFNWADALPPLGTVPMSKVSSYTHPILQDNTSKQFGFVIEQTITEKGKQLPATAENKQVATTQESKEATTKPRGINLLLAGVIFGMAILLILYLKYIRQWL